MWLMWCVVVQRMDEVLQEMGRTQDEADRKQVRCPLEICWGVREKVEVHMLGNGRRKAVQGPCFRRALS